MLKNRRAIVVVGFSIKVYNNKGHRARGFLGGLERENDYACEPCQLGESGGIPPENIFICRVSEISCRPILAKF